MNLRQFIKIWHLESLVSTIWQIEYNGYACCIYIFTFILYIQALTILLFYIQLGWVNTKTNTTGGGLHELIQSLVIPRFEFSLRKCQLEVLLV